MGVPKPTARRGGSAMKRVALPVAVAPTRRSTRRSDAAAGKEEKQPPQDNDEGDDNGEGEDEDEQGDEDAEEEEEEEEEQKEEDDDHEQPAQPATRRSSRKPTPRRHFAEEDEAEAEGDDDNQPDKGRKKRAQKATPKAKAAHNKGKKSKKVKKEEEAEEDEADGEEEEEEHDEEEEQEEEEEKEEGSSGKKKRKTGRGVKVSVKEEEDDVHTKDEEDGEEEHGDEEGSGGKKKRKRAAAPRTPKRKGKVHLNPLTADQLTAVRAVVDSAASTSAALSTRCCPRCSSREASRAVTLNSLSLMAYALSAATAVADPRLTASSTTDDALTLAIKQGKVACARLLWQHLQDKLALSQRHRGHYTKAKGADEEEEGDEDDGAAQIDDEDDQDGMEDDDEDQDDASEADNRAAVTRAVQASAASATGEDNKEVLPASRVALPASSLATLDTGASNFHAYGHATRKLNASRGGKEGNNAFVADPATDTNPQGRVDRAVEAAFRHGSVDVLQMMMQTRSGDDTHYFKPRLPKGAAYITCSDAILNHIRQRGILVAAQSGNVRLVKHMLSLLLGAGDTSAGFNKLHELVCDPKAALPPFRAPSATKKAQDNDAITPVHLACLSPDTAHLKKLIDVAGPQVLQAEDRQHRKPIHFAAVSATPDALKLLLKYGVSLTDRDRALKTALDYAVERGREHNISLLIPQPHKPAAEGDEEEDSKGKKGGKASKGGRGKKRKSKEEDEDEEDEKAEGDGAQHNALMDESVDDAAADGRRLSKKELKEQAEAAKLNKLMNDPTAFLNNKDKKTGVTLLHTAAQAGHAAAVAALCKAGADPTLADREKLTPLILACQRGSVECAQALVEAARSRARSEGADEEAAEGALLLHKDRTGKLAAHHAVLNGHFALVRLLLEAGVDVNSADSSDNTLLHYAVAYGQASIAELLMAAGAERSQLNMWKLSPLFVAMLKSHLHCAELLLTGGHVDVNQRDSEGRTLLMHTVASKADGMEGALKQVDFLLRQRTQADVHTADTAKQRTVLHTLTALPPAHDHQQDLALLQRLLDAGALADVNRQDSSGYTPLALAVQANNAPVVEALLANGADKGLLLKETNKSCLMLALELAPPALSSTQQPQQHYHWNQRPDPQKERRKFEKSLKQRREFMDARHRILAALIGRPAGAKEAKQSRAEAKTAGRRGKQAARAEGKEEAMDTTADGGGGEQSRWASAIDSHGENALFYAARSVVALEDTVWLLESPTTKPHLDINVQPHPERGGGTVLARVLCQQPQASAVVRPDFKEPTNDDEKAQADLTEPTTHLYRHVQLVHSLVSHGADVSVEWRSELPETDDAAVLKEAKQRQETRSLLMLALQAQPKQLVLPLFSLLCKAKAPLDGLAMPGSRSLLHLLLAKGREMDVAPFLELIQQRADSDAADQLVLKDAAALPDSSGLTPTLALWKAALPLPASTGQPRSPGRSPRKADKPQLPVCQYGASCYRRNPQHFAQFSHPPRDGVDADEAEGNNEDAEEEEDGEEESESGGSQAQHFLPPPPPPPVGVLPSAGASASMAGIAAYASAVSTSARFFSAIKTAAAAPFGGFGFSSSGAASAQTGFRLPTLAARLPAPLFGQSGTGASEPATTTSAASSGERVSKWLEVDDASAPLDVSVATALLPHAASTAPFSVHAPRCFSQLELLHTLLGAHLADTVQKSDEAKKEEEKRKKEQKRRDKQRGADKYKDDADSDGPQAELNKLHDALTHPPMQRDLSCTALHLAVLAGDAQAVQWLVKHGADVLAGDWFERTPLLLSVKDSSRVDIPQALLAERAAEQLGAVDKLGVTPLMAAVAYSASHSSDSTREFVESFAVESLLMRHTRDLNRVDKLGRSVVHYVFCPLHEEHTSGAVGDPIELLADLVAAASNPANAANAASARSSSSSAVSSSALSLDVPDVYQRTPLHYCSEMGAQICLKYLVARGADPKRIDADGNGAFQLALLHEHRGYCVDLVDKGVDIARPIVQQPRRRERKANEEVRRLATFEYVLRKSWSGLAYLMMDAGIPLTVAVRDALATDRFQLVVTLIKKAGAEQIHTVDAETGRNVLHAVADYAPSTPDCAHHFNATWSGNIYQALQQLGLKTAKAAAAQTKNGALPLHLAAAHDHLPLMEALLTAYPAGLDARDGDLKTPLHYAVQRGHLKAAHLLCKKGAKLDWPTTQLPASSDLSALALLSAVRGGAAADNLEDAKYSFAPLVIAARHNHYLIVELLLLYGADPNVVDHRGRTILMRAVTLNDSRLARLALHAPQPHLPDTKPSYARWYAPAKPKLKASNVQAVEPEGGNTALHLLVVPNGQYEPSYENVALLREVVQLTQLKLAGGEHNAKCKWDVKNKAGHTAAYYAAQQSSGVVLKALTDLGVQVSAAVLSQAKSDRAQWEKQNADDSVASDRDAELDVDKDAAALKQWIAAKQQLEASKDEDDSGKVPVDEEKFAATYTVLMDDSDPANLQPFDVMLTFTDTGGRHNRFGQHQFYKMQLLYNQPQDLYLLWNRWGRVGTRGEYQQTPQSTREAAIKEFKSIFKSKSANAWEQRSPEAFQVKPGKYTIDRSKPSARKAGSDGQSEEGEASVVSLQQLMAEYGKQLPPSTLPAPLQTLIAAICDLSSMQALAKRLGVETSKAQPLGELSDEQVQQGKAILAQLSDKVEQYTQAQSEVGQVQAKLNELQGKEYQLSMGQQMQQQAGDGDMKDDEKAEPSSELVKLQAEREQLQAELQRRVEANSALDGELTSLSNSYYTVIPSSQYAHSAISAIRSKEQLRKEQYNLSQMLDLHIATKILMGARASVIRLLSDTNPTATSSSSSSNASAAVALAQINRALSDLSSTRRLNPLDYCHLALRVDMRLLEHDSSEFKRLRGYMHASTPDSGSAQQWELYDVVSVRRHGEEARFQAVSKAIPNHALLWHGSGMGNFAGLLTQGLRIAPPEALASGYMFGKGVYCADQFAKSVQYCQAAQQFTNNPYARFGRQPQEDESRRSFCLLLVEVALGSAYRAYGAEYMDEARPGHHSTKGVGRQQPDPAQQLVTPDGVVIPCGPLVAAEAEAGRQAALENNEFIVYREEQCCIRYVLRVGPPRPKRSAREAERERTEVQWRENEEEDDEDGDGEDAPQSSGRPSAGKRPMTAGKSVPEPAAEDGEEEGDEDAEMEDDDGGDEEGVHGQEY